MRVRGEISPRLSLLQVLTASDGNVTANLGGQFLSNIAVVDVGYQTTHTPFGPSAFVRALTLDVRVQVRGTAVTAATYVTPSGSVRYTVSASRLLSVRGRGSEPTTRVRLGRYAVRGEVVDTSGRPVVGAALQIGGEFLMTDAHGGFVLRLDKARPLDLVVMCDEFAAVGRYEVVSAPPRVTPSQQGDGSGVRIVVRRI